MRRRNTVSVTPAMGASTVAGADTHPSHRVFLRKLRHCFHYPTGVPATALTSVYVKHTGELMKQPVLMFVLGAVLASGIAVLLVNRKSAPEPAVTTAVTPAPVAPAVATEPPPAADKPSALQAPEQDATLRHRPGRLGRMSRDIRTARDTRSAKSSQPAQSPRREQHYHCLAASPQPATPQSTTSTSVSPQGGPPQTTLSCRLLRTEFRGRHQAGRSRSRSENGHNPRGYAAQRSRRRPSLQQHDPQPATASGRVWISL